VGLLKQATTDPPTCHDVESDLAETEAAKTHRTHCSARIVARQSCAWPGEMPNPPECQTELDISSQTLGEECERPAQSVTDEPGLDDRLSSAETRRL
jgi:hypothetical protein